VKGKEGMGGLRRTSHEGVAEIVFALGVVFDIFPFEIGAAAAVG
jgi:hypothetical protein